MGALAAAEGASGEKQETESECAGVHLQGLGDNGEGTGEPGEGSGQSRDVL